VADRIAGVQVEAIEPDAGWSEIDRNEIVKASVSQSLVMVALE
jgi:hypothetical protein